MTWWGFGRRPIVPPVATPSVRTIRVTVRERGTSAALPLATGTILPDGREAPIGSVNVDGRLSFVVPVSITGGGWLSVSAPGYQLYRNRLVLDLEQPDLYLDLEWSRPVPRSQLPLGGFDPDDPGGNVSRSCPPEQVIPVGPSKAFWRGDFGGMTLVDRDGRPIQLQEFPGVTNTTPRNMYMTFLVGMYSRRDQDLLLTGHCERSYTHFWGTADVELLRYILTWTDYAGCWIVGDQAASLRSWEQAKPQVQPFLDALAATGPATCERIVVALGKEVNSSFSPEGLEDTIDHVGPFCRDSGIELALHFSPKVASWQLPTETPVRFWQKMSAAGVRRGLYQAVPTNPPGTILAQLWDMRKYLHEADPSLMCTFFEGYTWEQLLGHKTEEDGCRLGLEAVYAVNPPGVHARAVDGAGSGLRNLDGSPV